MPLDYTTLESMRQNHPAWRLLASPHAPLMVSFFQRAFMLHNIRLISQADLVEALEDELFQIRQIVGADKYPKSAIDYLNDWAAPEKGWLRKFYAQNSDEIQFDLTASTEKAISWLQSLTERSFVGTESRLLTLFEILRQLSEGSDKNPQSRLEELHKQRAAIDEKIAQVALGNVPLLEDSALRDRFMQFSQQAGELLSDFREVEYNFRKLDRNVREQIALWEGSKGELLSQIMGERDAIADSDQGASFRAFWDFLMSPERQQTFSDQLEQVLSLPAIQALKPDRRMRRIHHDWLNAGEHTQRTVAQLSQQLRRFLDDQAWLENRRIMDILQGIESKALSQRDTLFKADTQHFHMLLDDFTAHIELPVERPLYTPSIKPLIASIKLEDGDPDLDLTALYSQVVVDKAAITRHIQQTLQQQSQVSLVELCLQRPLSLGLAELLVYLEIGDSASQSQRFQLLVDETQHDFIDWQTREDENASPVTRRARIPRILFVRPQNSKS
jgi:flagellar motility protein MotE (MotC chaperone)